MTMRNPLSALIVAVQLISLAAVLGAGAKPLWRLGTRTVAAWQADGIWSEWKARKARGDGAHIVSKSGDPVGWLRIPAIGVESLVVFDASEENLAHYPSVHASTFGRAGLPVIIAHRDTHFAAFKDLRKGDVAFFESADGTPSQFQVARIEIIDPHDVPQTVARRDQTALLLLTCWPFHHVGPAPQRVVFTLCRS